MLLSKGRAHNSTPSPTRGDLCSSLQICKSIQIDLQIVQIQSEAWR